MTLPQFQIFVDDAAKFRNQERIDLLWTIRVSMHAKEKDFNKVVSSIEV